MEHFSEKTAKDGLGGSSLTPRGPATKPAEEGVIETTPLPFEHVTQKELKAITGLNQFKALKPHFPPNGGLCVYRRESRREFS